MIQGRAVAGGQSGHLLAVQSVGGGRAGRQGAPAAFGVWRVSAIHVFVPRGGKALTHQRQDYFFAFASSSASFFIYFSGSLLNCGGQSAQQNLIS
jgi:hypothetical protein